VKDTKGTEEEEEEEEEEEVFHTKLIKIAF
jgi:hypothetical protein